jgi:hypothetical protein
MVRAFEEDPEDTEQLSQIAFVSALTISSSGLAGTGNIDYA